MPNTIELSQTHQNHITLPEIQQLKNTIPTLHLNVNMKLINNGNHVTEMQ